MVPSVDAWIKMEQILTSHVEKSWKNKMYCYFVYFLYSIENILTLFFLQCRHLSFQLIILMFLFIYLASSF